MVLTSLAFNLVCIREALEAAGGKALTVAAPTKTQVGVAVLEPEAGQVKPAPSVKVFDHPKSYADYFARYPDHVKAMCLSMKCASQALEDMIQGIHLHLMTPTRETETSPSRDRLSTYNGNLRGGAVSENAWWDWINLVIQRQYNTLIKRANRGGITGPNVFSLSSFNQEERSLREDRLQMTTDDIGRMRYGMVGVTDVIFLDNFAVYLDQKDEDLGRLFRAIRDCDGSTREAARWLGVPAGTASKQVDAIKMWASVYTRNNAVLR